MTSNYTGIRINQDPPGPCFVANSTITGIGSPQEKILRLRQRLFKLQLLKVLKTHSHRALALRYVASVTHG